MSGNTEQGGSTRAAPLSLRLGAELLAAVDVAVAGSGLGSRNAWIVAVLEAAVGRGDAPPAPPAPRAVGASSSVSAGRPAKYTPAEMAQKRENYRRMGWELADFSERPEPPADLVKEGERVLAELQKADGRRG